MSDLLLENEQYVAFKLSNEIYAVNIKIVKTVEKILKITRVPKSEEYIVGVINLRGEIVPIIDLRKRFNMAFEEHTEDTRIMVLSLEGSEIGVLVDSVDEVINIAKNSIQNATNINSTVNAGFVVGVSKVEDRVITILNFEQLSSNELE